MKLQVCHHFDGWVDVVTFDAERRYEVADAAASLARASGVTAWRIVGDDGGVCHLNDNGVFRSGGL